MSQGHVVYVYARAGCLIRSAVETHVLDSPPPSHLRHGHITLNLYR